MATSAKSTSKGILLIFRNSESNDKLSAGLSFTSLNAKIYGLHLTKNYNNSRKWFIYKSIPVRENIYSEYKFSGI